MPFFMMLNIHYLVSLISSFFSVLSLLFGIYFFKSLKQYLAIFYIVCFSAFFELLGIIFSRFGLDTSHLNQTYTIVEFSVLYYFYYNYYNFFFKITYLHCFYFLFMIISLYDFKNNNSSSFDGLSLIVESVFFIILSLLSFLYIIKHLIFDKITDNPFFWANSGVLIYFSGNILIFLFFKLIDPKDFYWLYLFVHSSLNITYSSLLCVSFYKSKKL